MRLLCSVPDMFPSFPVPRGRALTNAVALKCRLGDFSGTRALAELQLRLGAAASSLHDNSIVVACNASMVMGDINAVDFCMGAHLRALERSPAAYPPSCRVEGRAPFPRGPHAEAVVVDDRVGLGVVRRGQRRGPEALERSFEAGGAALQEAGFGIHDGKSVRNARHATPLGIEIRGDVGLAGAERARR